MYQTANGITYGFDLNQKYDPIEKRTVSQLLQLFPGMGCVPWLKTKAECCPFCRLPAGTRLAVLGPDHEDHFEPWSIAEEDYFEMIDTSLAQEGHIDKIACFNGGSFLTDREIPQSVRRYLYRRVGEHPTAKGLMVEARPEFVREAALKEAEERLNGKRLTIAIGLESTNDKTRNGPLAKFIGWKSFTSALNLLHDRGHKSFVYVFLGAPGLPEDEAYLDAENSVRQLTEMGVDHIALSCAFVPPGGRLEEWYNAGRFRPPHLWTIAKLVEKAQSEGWPLTLGGFDDFPPPVAIPQNCGICDEAFHTHFDRFRRDNRFDAAALPACNCCPEWLMAGT